MYNKPIIDGVNISLKLKYDKRTLTTISYINASGEKQLIPVVNKITKQIKVWELCNLLSGLLKYNVYELISEVPDLETVNVDIDAVNNICLSINEQCYKEYHEVQGKNVITVDKSAFIIQTNKVSDIIAFSDSGYKNFILEIDSEEELEKSFSLPYNITYRLPVIDFSGYTEKLIQKLTNKNIMITKISQLIFLEKYDFKNVMADYSVNCWNEISLILLKKYGVSDVTIHPELKMDYSIKMIEKNGLVPTVIISGKIPLGFSRACFSELNICNHKCNDSIRMKNISKDYEVLFDCSNDYGYRTLYRDGVDVAYSDEGNFKKRIIISNFTEELKNEFLKNDLVKIDNPNFLYRRSVK